MKTQTHIFTKTLVGLLALAMFATGCTKKRAAALPDTDAVNTFAISDFGDVQNINSAYSIKTDSSQIQLNRLEAPKADNEEGKVLVNTAVVPANLQFMFDNLKISGQASQNLPVTFAVDKKYVTAYKLTKDLNSLSALEKQYAKIRDEVVLETKLQRTTKKSDRQQISSQLQALSEKRLTHKGLSANTIYMVPMFKYEVTGYGVLERAKNELREETSVLQLRKTDWNQATHIQIKALRDDSAPVAIDPDQQEKLDRTFATSRLNNQIMNAGDLRDVYQIPTAMNDSDLVLTSLDDDGLSLYQLTEKSQLSATQKNLIKSGFVIGKIEQCPASVVQRLTADHPEIAKDCVMIERYQVPVTYVRVRMPVTDADGNEAPTIQLDEINYSNNTGLVTIPQNVQPKRMQTDDIYDSSSMLRVVDVKGKEFFFRRTLEDAPLTTTYMVGEAGSVDIVRFELQDTRLVVRRADNLIKFKSGNNAQETEDLMSIPVTYIRRDLKDSRGNDYTTPHYVQANKETAEYIVLNWAQNTLPASNSPIAYYGGGSCLAGIANTSVQEVDNRIDKGVLNFSFQYSAALNLSEACVGIYSGAGDYSIGSQTNQFNARLKERISFKLNDGSSDKSFVPQTPFRVQNALGYGVWTIGKISPDDHGLYGREGSQINLPVVQDFRNGKILTYTITGLESLDAGRRQLNLDTVKEIIAAWNLAYHNAFKGTSLDRSGDYIQIQVAGENGVTAHLGDLDKNIVHFENKVNDNHGTLGVSQVGFNYRSGIVVADSLIVFAGNLEKYVASVRRNVQISNNYKDMVAGFREQALAQLKKDQEDQAAAAKQASGAVTADPKAAASDNLNAAKNVMKFISQQAKVKTPALSAGLLNQVIKNKTAAMTQLRDVFRQRQALGGSGNFKFSAPNIEGAYIDRVLKKVIQSSDIEGQDYEGLVAQEMLTSLGNKLSPQDKAALQRRASLMTARDQMKAQFASKPGCMLTERESLGRGYTDGTFEEAYKRALHFDLGHEMGHSQGLTHNFIGSFDRANFKHSDEDKADTLNAQIAAIIKKANDNPNLTDADIKTAQAQIAEIQKQLDSMLITNYSSIMDYIEPAQLKWGGIGNYDARALRASHLGLIEMTPAAIDALTKKGMTSSIQNGKYLHISTIQKLFASGANGWSNFTANTAKGFFKEYKYCTDIDVGYEPTCQRFDLGTSASEIVQNLIEDYQEHYINSYYSWNRLNFGYYEESMAMGGSMRMMLSMRQFLDETFYKAIVDHDQAAISDNAQASVLAYFFFNQVIHTPDANSLFLSNDRFVAQPYQTKDGGMDVEIVEKRALGDITLSKDRLDTVGIERDKTMAMQLLTLKGLQSYKYASNTIEYSYLDFEKYFMGISTENSPAVATLTGVFLDQLQPTFTNLEKGQILAPVSNATTSVSSLMRSYAGISAILSLESSTLTDKDNFATLFKVGSSIGSAAPSDRLALPQLGVSNASKTKVTYWALDNADSANAVINSAGKLVFFLQNNDQLEAGMDVLAKAQLDEIMAMAMSKSQEEAQAAATKAEPAVNAAKADLMAKLTALNKNGDLITEAAAKQGVTMGMFVNKIAAVNQVILAAGISSLAQGGEDVRQLQQVAAEMNTLADQMPIFVPAQKALIKVTTNITLGGKTLSSIISQAVSGTQTEFRYGLLMKNVQFLNMLTLMTNPEYNR